MSDESRVYEVSCPFCGHRFRLTLSYVDVYMEDGSEDVFINREISPEPHSCPKCDAYITADLLDEFFMQLGNLYDVTARDDFDFYEIKGKICEENSILHFKKKNYETYAIQVRLFNNEKGYIIFEREIDKNSFIKSKK